MEKIYAYDLELGAVKIHDDEIPYSLFIPEKWKAGRHKHLVIINYGGSRSFSRSKTLKMMHFYAARGLAVASYDYRGMHPTRTPFEATGVATRVDDGCAILAELYSRWSLDRISLIGISMGGYVATHIAKYAMNELIPVRDLVLVASTAYHRSAFKNRIPFGDDFRALLRENNSWENSDAFDNVRRFRGALLIIKYGMDELIPPGVPKAYYRYANNRALFTIPYERHRGSFDGEKMLSISNTIFSWLKER